MKPRFIQTPEQIEQTRRSLSANPSDWVVIREPAFDSIVVEQLKCELSVARIVEQTLRARLANAQRLLQAAIGDSE